MIFYTMQLCHCGKHFFCDFIVYRLSRGKEVEFLEHILRHTHKLAAGAARNMRRDKYVRQTVERAFLLRRLRVRYVEQRAAGRLRRQPAGQRSLVKLCAVC